MTEKVYYTTVLIPSDVSKRRQGYGLIRVYEVTIPRYRSTPKVVRLRVDIDRNAYDQQSHYRIDVWMDGRGWVRVTEYLPESDRLTRLPFYTAWDRERQGCIEAVESLAAELVDDACVVLG
jgi:hypothetical protein